MLHAQTAKRITMFRDWRSLTVALAFIGLMHCVNASPISTKPSSDKEPPKLILISFDGFRWDYLTNNTLPNIKEHFVDNGAKAGRGVRNAFSTVTFPNHWSLATGLYPESHGIVANVIYDPSLNRTYHDFGPDDNSTAWFGQSEQALPIWILNQLTSDERRSVIVGSFPGANVPFRNMSVTYSLDYANKLSWTQKVDALVGLMAHADAAQRANLGVLYFDEPDATGHRFGPASTPQLRATLLECDRTVGYLVGELRRAGLFASTNIIITSDHGMDTATQRDSIDLSDYVDIGKFESYGGLTQVNIFLKDPSDEPDVYRALKKVPHYSVYRRDETPAHLHYRNNRRIGDLVMFGDVGHELFRANRSRFDWSTWKGDHGGDNAAEALHPLLVATGPAFRRNYSTNTTAPSQINIVDVYALMCAVLRLTPGTNINGSLENVTELLRVVDDGVDSSTYSAIKTAHEHTTPQRGITIVQITLLRDELLSEQRQQSVDDSAKQILLDIRRMQETLIELAKSVNRRLINSVNVLILCLFLLVFISVVHLKVNTWHEILKQPE